jgi:hypothetical protein
MAFNVNDFINQTKDGFAREAHFEIIFTLPNIISGNVKKLSFLCNSAAIPDRRLDTVKVRRTGQGFINSFAVGSEYGHLDLSFYCDAKSDNLKLVHKWLDAIFEVQGPDNLHTVAYRDDYVTTVTLIQYDSQGKVIAEFEFVEAFPEFISKINFSWGSHNNLVTIPVSFVYSYYIEKGQKPTVSDSITNNLQQSKINETTQKAASFINNETTFTINKLNGIF